MKYFAKAKRFLGSTSNDPFTGIGGQPECGHPEPKKKDPWWWWGILFH
jgi:hypothetical protein